MKIFKVKDTVLRLWDLNQWISAHPEVNEQRIGISWKKGKNRKLRTYRISRRVWDCDYCGTITSIQLTKGGKTHTMDNHFGLGFIYMTSL